MAKSYRAPFRGAEGLSVQGRRVIVYVRISRDPKGEGVGVTIQARDAEEWVRRNGGVLVWDSLENADNNRSAFKKRLVRVPDGEDGWRLAPRVIRPHWEDALRMIRAGEADTLLVVNQDRMVREPRDLEDAIELVEHYRALVVDVSGDLDLTTDQGIFVARLLVAHANMSSRDTSRRVRRRRQADAEAGKPHKGGNRAFGYGRDGVTVMEAEAELIRDAYKRILAGTSPFTLCAEWNRRGLRSPRGKLWRPQSLHVILTNPKLVGLSSVAVPASDAEYGTHRWRVRTRADGTEVAGRWPAIITDRAQWEAVCARFAAARHRAGVMPTGKNTRRYLLSGLLRCGRCGGRMTGSPRPARKDGTPTFAYRCSEGAMTGVCTGLLVLGMPVEEHITEAVLARHEADLAARSATFERPAGVWAGEADLARIERKLAEAHSAWKTDRLAAADYFTVREELEADRAALRRDQAAWMAAQPRPAADLGDVRARWDKPVEDGGLCLAAKREFLFGHLRAVQLADGRDPVTGRQRRRFNPDRLTLVWRDTLPAAAAGPAAA